ncbi:MAG: (2Fe-2S)-binding protein [Deltaproteobacteria bacterium]|nr:(2Fe-2S)-binding protein [Deltaproteobacteria bacterium]
MGERVPVLLRIDGREVRAQAGESLLQVARREGFAIPSLCWHERLSSYGACRLCLVEIKRGKKSRLVTSCDFPAMDGIEVATDTEQVQARRRTVVQLLAAMAPGAPEIQRLALAYGADLGPLVADAGGDCILCGLCVRVCREMVGANAVEFQNRGGGKILGAPWGEPSERCISCGACAAVCPVNARRTLAGVIRRLRHEGTGEHPCRYTLLGLFSDGVCANRYECERCEVEQRMRDGLRGHPVFLLPGAARDRDG